MVLSAAFVLGTGCRDEGCTEASDCPPSLVCDARTETCEPPAPVEVDAAVDAGERPRPDGGAEPDDSGASVDAGVLDTGADADAGIFDAPPLDGGFDAGGLDAEMAWPDAGFDPVRLQFPPGGRAVTSTDAITVRGEITSLAAVSAVSVNGVSATSDDGFAHFTAEIPLAPGVNAIEVAYTEGGQPLVAVSGSVERQDILLLTPIEFTEHGGALYVVDSAMDRLVRVDPLTGDAVEVSGPSAGSGTGFINPQGLVVTSSGAEAFVLDRSRDAVLRVDLQTGARSIFSRGGTEGSGPNFADPRQIGLDEGGGRLFVVDSNRDTLFAVSLSDGARSVISSDDVGGGDTFATPRAVVWDARRDRVLVADTTRDTIFAVDPVTGARTRLTGTGPSLPSPNGIALTGDGDGLWIADLGDDKLVRMDLVTGNRTLVADAGRGRGPWIETRAVVEAPSGVYVLDNARDGIVRVDPVTGDRVSVYVTSTFEGAPYGTPWGVAVHPTDPTADIFVTDNYFDRIIALDPRTGARRVHHSGATISAPYGMAYDAPNRRVLFTDITLDALMAVDVNDGSATFVSDEVVAGGPLFGNPRDVVLGPNGRMFVVDNEADSVFEIGPRGQRILLGSDFTGTGAEIEAPYAVEVLTSSSGVEVLVADEGVDAILRVDPVTLERAEWPAFDGALSTPRGLLRDPGRDVLYVSDFSRRLIYRLDLASQERTILGSASVGRGVRMTAPVNLSYHPDDYLIVVDNNDALIAIDLATSERIYLSK